MIRLEHVSKSYPAGRQRKTIVRDLTMTFDEGARVGILGVNGAGKSTLIRMIAGVEAPDRGRVTRLSRVSWPLGFSGGLHRHLTGRENLRFVSRIYGEDERRVLRFVEDFAELGAHLDMRTGTYSSGMKARLAFGLSMAMAFDFYLVDEVTAVGDKRFRQRCDEMFNDRLKNAGLLMVSHSPGTIRSYCRSGAILAGGDVIMYERVDEAMAAYEAGHAAAPTTHLIEDNYA